MSENWVNNAFGKDDKYMVDLYLFDFIYLQNGIIKDDLSHYLNRITKKFDLIITSSKKEYKSFLNRNYNYNIHDLALIIIFPTWRLYLQGTRDLITLKPIESKSFVNTTYFFFYNNLINDQNLLNIMKENGYEGIFCLHPNFAAQYKHFNENNIFKVEKKCNKQELFAKASLLVTDYSSIFYDFGYIQKPIIYCQFDYEEYRNKQFSKGYFDYKKDGFGKICYDMQCTIKTIISEIKNKCILKKLYDKRIKKFFLYHDDKNCYRAFIEIKKLNIKEIKLEYSIKRNIYIIFIFLIINKLIINI